MPVPGTIFACRVALNNALTSVFGLLLHILFPPRTSKGQGWVLRISAVMQTSGVFKGFSINFLKKGLEALGKHSEKCEAVDA